MKLTGRLIDPTGGDVVMPRTVTVHEGPMAAVAHLVFALTMNAGSKGAFEGNPAMKIQVELDGRIIWQQSFGQRPPFRIRYDPADYDE